MAPSPLKKKKRKNRSAARKYWSLAPVVGGVVLLGYLATGPRWSKARIDLPSVGSGAHAGYVADAKTVAQEYQRFYGKPLTSADAERMITEAREHIAKKDYTTAVSMLEQATKIVAVPAVFNDLGVLYAEVNDKSRSINAFREALARDIDYQPVRTNLARLKDITALGAEPVSAEVEPNNNPALANIIAPGKPVDGEIAAAVNDLDWFLITTPPAPRDLITIEIQNHSATLAPVLKIFDAERRITELGKTEREPGRSLKVTVAPAPNTTYFLQLSGYASTAGAYTLLVQPLKAFDGYEPNDDIYHSRRIALGTPVEGNIMDAADTDYFSFVSPRNGTVNIVINNKSATLIPALSTFSPDMRSSGFGPDIRTPGLNLRHTLKVFENEIYYVQVWSQANTAGKYSLLIE